MTRQIVAIGGTVRPGSSTERSLALAAAEAERQGAVITLYGGAYIAGLPHYRGPDWTPDKGREMIEALRSADGVLLATPGYHGTVSGMVKNAIDYLEELADDQRPYLSGRPVGLIATAWGHQAANSSMTTLRTIAHALRGWPTPFGAALRIDPTTFAPDGSLTDPGIADQLVLVGRQVGQAAGRLG